MNIGIDFSTFEASEGRLNDLTTASLNSWTASPGSLRNPLGETVPLVKPEGDAAFKLYYDNATSRFCMCPPLVADDVGKEVECTVPSEFGAGKTYYCEVVYSGGKYSAKVTDTPSEKPSPPQKLVWCVKLFEVPGPYSPGDLPTESPQYHVGAVVVSGSGSSPCRVDSIDDATYPVPTGMEDTGQVITVNYTKAGDDCDDSGETSFTIPILRTKGGGGGGGDFSMDVTDQAVPGTQDHPNGGVKVTLSPSAGQGTNFTVWNGKDGENGKDAVVNVTQAANGATDVHKNGGTKVTLTPNNGGAAATFDVWNGNDGKDGDPGRSVVSASSGDPSQDGDYTVTPVTFVDSAGNMIGPVDVKAKNGNAGISGVQIEFDRDGNKRLEYSVDGGQSWILVAETVALSSVV